jgi:hypothetical protein
VQNSITKSPGQLAYERDLQRTPKYQDGKLRCNWAALFPEARWSWERNPTDRQHP